MEPTLETTLAVIQQQTGLDSITAWKVLSLLEAARKLGSLPTSDTLARLARESPLFSAAAQSMTWQDGVLYVAGPTGRMIVT